MSRHPKYKRAVKMLKTGAAQREVADTLKLPLSTVNRWARILNGPQESASTRKASGARAVAVTLMAAGLKRKQIAEQLGVAEETVCRWASEPDFITGVEAIHNEVRESAKGLALDAVELAYKTLREVAGDPKAVESARVAAARELLDRAIGKAKSDLQVQGPAGGPVRVEVAHVFDPVKLAQLADEELAKLLSAVDDPNDLEEDDAP